MAHCNNRVNTPARRVRPKDGLEEGARCLLSGLQPHQLDVVSLSKLFCFLIEPVSHENRLDLASSEFVFSLNFQQRPIFHCLMGSRKRADGLYLDNRSRSVGVIEFHIYSVAAQELVFNGWFRVPGEPYTFRTPRDEVLEIPVLVTFAALTATVTTGMKKRFRIRIGTEFVSEGSNDGVSLRIVPQAPQEVLDEASRSVLLQVAEQTGTPCPASVFVR